MDPELIGQIIGLIFAAALGALALVAIYAQIVMAMVFPWKKHFPLSFMLPLLLFPRFHDTDLGQLWCRRFWKALRLLLLGIALFFAILVLNYFLEFMPPVEFVDAEKGRQEFVPTRSALDTALYSILPSIIAAFIIIGLLLGLRSIHEYFLRR